MAVFDNTTNAATINEVWDRAVEQFRYAKGVFLNRINNKSSLVKESGDIINFSIKKEYTVGTIPSGGAITPQSWTMTTVALTVDKNQEITVETEDKTKAQSFWDANSDLPKDAGAAFAAEYDRLIAAQHGDFTLTPVNAADTTSAFGKNSFTTAMLRMDDNNVPQEDRSFFLSPNAYWAGLMNEMQLTAANEAGLPKNVLTTGFRFSLGGVPFYTSTKIATVGTVRKGILLHKSALAIAFQRNCEIRRADRLAGLVDSYVAMVKSLYGIKMVRADYGVVINYAA